MRTTDLHPGLWIVMMGALGGLVGLLVGLVYVAAAWLA